MSTFEHETGSTGATRETQLRAEIATLNKMMHRTREEDAEIAGRINAEPDFATLGTETLEANNQAVINQRAEIEARARALGISLEEALKIGVDESVS